MSLKVGSSLWIDLTDFALRDSTQNGLIHTLGSVYQATYHVDTLRSGLSLLKCKSRARFSCVESDITFSTSDGLKRPAAASLGQAVAMPEVITVSLRRTFVLLPEIGSGYKPRLFIPEVIDSLCHAETGRQTGRQRQEDRNNDTGQGDRQRQGDSKIEHETEIDSGKVTETELRSEKTENNPAAETEHPRDGHGVRTTQPECQREVERVGELSVGCRVASTRCLGPTRQPSYWHLTPSGILPDCASSCCRSLLAGDWPSYLPVSHYPVRQPANQPISQSASQPVSQSANQSANQAANQSSAQQLMVQWC